MVNKLFLLFRIQNKLKSIINLLVKNVEVTEPTDDKVVNNRQVNF